MAAPLRYEAMDEKEKVQTLNDIIAEWREPALVLVKPERVIPDTTNREYTGISVNHMHFVAVSMQRQGFTPRDNVTGKGHDLPLLVRDRSGPAGSALGAESLNKWRAAQAANADYPPAQPWMSLPAEEFFCSLGNGHFFQALNLFGAASMCKLGTKGLRYSMVRDEYLTQAVRTGVWSVVLRSGIPETVRKFVSLMLNSTFEFQWTVGPDGAVRVDDTTMFRQFSSFDGLVKHADTFELDHLIELRMRADREEREEKRAILEARRQQAGHVQTSSSMQTKPWRLTAPAPPLTDSLPHKSSL